MNNKYLFRSVFAVVLWTGFSTAHAYTAIAVSETTGHFGYSHLPQPKSVVDKLALQNCNLAGGTNPRLVLSTGKNGHFAVAASGAGKARVFGWAGPAPSAKAAEDAAIANCKKRGGADPKVRAQWADHASSLNA